MVQNANSQMPVQVALSVAEALKLNQTLHFHKIMELKFSIKNQKYKKESSQ